MALVLAVTGVPMAATAATRPILNEVSLSVQGRRLTPVAVKTQWRRECWVGNQPLIVDKGRVEKLADAPDHGWTATSGDDLHLHWLAAQGTEAYLVGYESDKEGRFRKWESPPRLRRLDLKSGTWLDDLPVFPRRLLPGGPKPAAVLSVLPGDDGLAVLVSMADKPNQSWMDPPTAFHLTYFSSDKSNPLWSKTFNAEGGRPYTGAFVWGIQPPQYAGSHLQHLSWLGDRLLLCAEAQQPIYCLNRDTGSTIWSVERVWEFQRGFVGPSCYSHYISRFGVERFVTDKSEAKEARKAAERYACSIVGGPVAIPIRARRGQDVLAVRFSGRRNDTHSIFVAVSRGPAEGHTGYLSDCLVYELNDDGKVISMANLPQMVVGGRYGVSGNHVVWKCQNDTFVSLAPAVSIPVVTMGGGSSDGISRVAWLKQDSESEAPAAWLVAGRAGDPVAFTDTHAFCLAGGGYIKHQDERVYRFPVTAIELSSGRQSTVVLAVPFDGEIEVPETNYSMHTLPDGSRGYRMSMWYGLAVTHLASSPIGLEIVVGNETDSSSVVFDMKALKDALGTETAPVEEADDMARAQTRVKALNDVNDPNTDGGPPLMRASGLNDPAHVRALLEAGADPMHVSSNGWSPLMYAACYGTAEVVDILIEAGSDLNAADGNCGGQTVLMWAARSPRESKKKVHSLLRAGADIQATSQTGRNAIMSASMAGNLVVHSRSPASISGNSTP